MKRLLSSLISATLGLWLASLAVPRMRVGVLENSHFLGIALTAPWQLFILLGVILGLLHFFVKPILNIITLPLRIITLGIFGFFINMALIFVVDMLFEEMYIPLWMPLAYATLVVSITNMIISKIFTRRSE